MARLALDVGSYVAAEEAIREKAAAAATKDLVEYIMPN
jgi:hypothetical protein